MNFELKNLRVYRMQGIVFNLEALQGQLQSMMFTPCGSQDMARTGWVPPMGEHSDQLFHFAANGHLLLLARREEKILPNSVLKDALRETVEKLEHEQHRKLKKTEKGSLKDEVLHAHLPRAFSKFKQTWLWIDTAAGLITVGAATAKVAEDLLALLRKSLGSLPVVPLTMESPIELTLTDWVRAGNPPAGYIFQDRAELKAILEEGGVLRCQKQDLVCNEIVAHLDAGKLVTQLQIQWQERITFTIHDDGCLTGIRYADILLEQNNDIDADDHAQRFDADVILVTGELAAMLKSLTEVLGGELSRRGENREAV